jgi:hypothetical protein
MRVCPSGTVRPNAHRGTTFVGYRTISRDAMFYAVFVGSCVPAAEGVYILAGLTICRLTDGQANADLQ